MRFTAPESHFGIADCAVSVSRYIIKPLTKPLTFAYLMQTAFKSLLKMFSFIYCTLGIQHTLTTTLLSYYIVSNFISFNFHYNFIFTYLSHNSELSYQEESCEGAPEEPSHSPHGQRGKVMPLLFHCPGSSCLERPALHKEQTYK